MPKVAAATLTLTCLLAFILLVITSCSAPTSRSIYLFKITAKEPNGTVTLEAGILGVCVGAEVPAQNLNVGLCSPQILGYPVEIPQMNADGSADLTRGRTLASEHLTRSMIFTPLGAALSGLTTLIAGIAWATAPNTGMVLASLILSAITTVFSWLAFAVNLAVSVKVKHGFEDLPLQPGESMDFKYGAATFLPLVAAIILTVALGWSFVAYKREKREIQRRTSETATPFRTEEAVTDEKIPI